MPRNFVCDVCRQWIGNPYMQYVEAVEYRRIDARDRRLRYNVRDICRDCVDDIRDARTKNGYTQGTLDL